MTPEDFQQAAELFVDLRDLPESERRAALEAACYGNHDLREQVLRLLEADRNAAKGNFLKRRAMDEAAQLLVKQTRHAPLAGQGLPECGTVVEGANAARIGIDARAEVGFPDPS